MTQTQHHTVQDWTPLNHLGPLAVEAVRNVRARHGAKLPKPSQILVRIERQGKFTTASVKAGKRYATGVTAKNPKDKQELPIKARMQALSMALRALGEG